MVGFKFKLMLALRNIIPFEWFERIHEKIIVRMVTHPQPSGHRPQRPGCRH